MWSNSVVSDNHYGTPLIYVRTAKSRCDSDGSANLKNISAISSGDGVIPRGGFFFMLFEIIYSGKLFNFGAFFTRINFLTFPPMCSAGLERGNRKIVILKRF